ncbi:MAG: ATP-binding cassette domain-containing protein [Bacteroidota bacterium]
MEYILKLHKVCHRYKNSGKQTLKNISLSVMKGEKLAIIGETGSGKSTLLKCITGELAPESGSVVFANEKIATVFGGLISSHQKIKLVSQHYELAEEISAEENIKRKLLHYSEEFRNKKSNILLSLSGLKKLKDKKPTELSGGQQQLLSICCAIAEEPDLLLLDEPFSHLDHITRMDILDHLSLIIETFGMTCLLVSHDASDVLSFAGRIVVIEKGKINGEGSPEQLYYHPENMYIAGLLDHFNVSGSKITRPSQYEFCSPKTARYEGIVTEVVFRGPYYEIKVETKKGEMIIYSLSKSKKAGEKVFFRKAE